MKRIRRIKPYSRRKPGGMKKEVSVSGHNKNLSYSAIQNRGIRISKHGDVDRDGVPNYKDCKPFDPKKQGWLHDQKMKVLKKQEEYYEGKREQEQKKLEDIRDELKVKQNISKAKLDKKRMMMNEKQSRIDELNRERKKISELKDANLKAKKELEKYSLYGKFKRGGAALGRISVSVAKSSAKALSDADKALDRKTRSPKKRHRKTKTTSKRKVVKHKRRKKKDDFGW